MRKCRNSAMLLFAGWGTLLAILFLANLFWGSVSIPFHAVADILTGGDAGNEGWRLILLHTRLPQAVTALLAGMALSVAGLLLQTLFNNPLAGPEVLGINSGAGLGVAVVMLLLQGTLVAGWGGYLAVLAGAFMGALFIIAVVLLLARLLSNKIYLLIAGLAISYLTSSVISILNYFSTAEGVHSYLIWGMGSFGAVSVAQLPFYSVLLAVVLVAALLLVKPLNALLLGDYYALNLGINIKRVRGVLLLIVGLLTATVTAFCGPVAFIGLAVPHLSRLAVGTSNHRRLLPVTMLLGGTVTLLCNLVCQLPGESGLLPLGAITPLIGAPVIIYVVLKERSNMG
ncbi:MAG: iron ABC transporter permease [Bacteroidaceae bacterium]|nr:iron ABC transporter permease [Bacteroidaceae bacterium]